MIDNLNLVRGWRRILFWKGLHPAAKLVAMLLSKSDGWVLRTHEIVLSHDAAKVSIWVANRWYGFGFRIDGKEVQPNDMPWGLDRFSRSVLIYWTKRRLRAMKNTSRIGRLPSDEKLIVALAERVVKEFSGEQA